MISCSAGRRCIKAAALSALLVAGLASAQTFGVFPDRVVLYHVGPLSKSGLADSNKEALAAAYLYFAKVNARGGINGRKIVLETSDDNQDAKKSLEMTRAVIEKRGALAIFLLRTSPTVDALMPLAEEAGIPVIAPQVGPDSVTEPMKRHVFAVRASYSAEVESIIKLQRSFGRTKFAVVAAKGPFGESVARATQATLAALSLKPADVVQVDDRDPVVDEALKVFSAAKPDVVIMGCSSKCGASFVKGYNRSGNRAQYVALSNSSNSAFVRDLGDQGRGVIVMQVVPAPWSSKYAVAREFKVAAEAAKMTVTYSGMQAWVSARMVAEALQGAGANPTPASLTSALEAMQNYNLGDFIISYGPRQRAGSQFIEPTMIGGSGNFVY